MLQYANFENYTYTGLIFYANFEERSGRQKYPITYNQSRAELSQYTETLTFVHFLKLLHH